ncbi:TBC1 domain family member 31 [Trichogramma pretiosum]|uniref:TBC1 domain family member 31 n=1 Tax=Trichogramma pretiosum TaxID=7493 RepID=UPI0006C9C3FB|nr:TBC1 domain family member 31 [Trichogramma pretiosum]
MQDDKWIDLEKSACSNHYQFKVESAYGGSHCPSTMSFSQCAFDNDDETLIAIDNNGIAYCIDLSDFPSYRKLGCVGMSTFVTFNPYDKNELLIGLSSTNIKVMRLNAINDFCSLTGHTAPATSVSFYKDYCMTSSSKEVIVWMVKSYCKIHQLRLNTKNIVVKKAMFSSLGLVAVLYATNIIQCWPFQQFEKDYKIDMEKQGLKSVVKDFEFTRDGRAMIVCGLQNKILVFNATRWDVLKSLEFHDNFSGGKQVSIVPMPLDGGANSIVAILTSDCALKLISLASSSVIYNCCNVLTGIKKIAVSQKGCYLASINKNGSLDLTFLEKILNIKSDSGVFNGVEKPKNQRKIQPNKNEEHLKCVRNAVKEELKLQRLIPILKEFGEYPEKHRRLIWSTIMELPSNRKAFVDLSNKVPHQAMFDLLKKDSLIEKCKSSVLGTTLSCLLHWCPILSECDFLPKTIIPFVNIFQKSPILALETCLFVLMNYCQKWFEYHPLPPLNILGMVENVLLEADPILFDYFCEQGITSTTYAWPLLHSTMSEVLSVNDWLILWDHLFSLRKPWFLMMCTIAYSILYRKTIITKLHTIDDFTQFYKTVGHVSIKNILKIAHKLDRETPHRIHPHRYLKNDVNTLPKKGPYQPFLQYEFPKYLTDELRGITLKKLKEKERRLRGFQLHAMELLEEKRLRVESENFVRNIHEMRLNELRKCYENQVKEDEKLLEYTKKKTEDLDPCKYLSNVDTNWNDICSSGRSRSDLTDHERRRRRKHRSSRSLQEQVDRLEYEVHHLLAKLQSRPRSRYK